MTAFNDVLYQGAAYYNRSTLWNSPTAITGLPVSTRPYDTQIIGVPHSQTFVYQLGTASTAGTATSAALFYSATGATGGITLNGPRVSGGVGTFDLPRGVRITSSVNLSTVTFTIRGTDGYGATLAVQMLGPSGNTFGNVGSYRDSTSAFKTITSASGNGSTGTTAFSITNNDTYGLPYHLPNVGAALGQFLDGTFPTIPGTFTAGFTATGTPGATTADVRGLVTLSTVLLANDSRYITVHMVAPPASLASNPGLDDKNHSYGATPYSG